MRKSHVLSSNKGQSIPSHCLWFDVETYDLPKRGDRIPSRMRLFTAVYQRLDSKTRKYKPKWYKGKLPAEFYHLVKSCIRKKTCLDIFSANIWFDMRHVKILEYLLSDGYKIIKFFDRGKTFYMKLRKKPYSIAFINVQNIIPFSVSKMGEVIGLPKLKVDFDNVSDEMLYVYCKRDTEIIYKTLLTWFKFIRDNNLGNFKPTIASQALTAFVHRFMKHKIYIHDTNHILNMERDAYQGGRTDTRFIGKVRQSPIYVMDINSQYPYVMSKHYFPYRLCRYRKYPDPEKVYKMCKHYCVIARCDISTNEPVYGHSIDNRLCFPVGRFTQSLATASYMYAYEHGHIARVREAAFYNKSYLFKSWSQELYNKRLEAKNKGNGVYSTLIKLILNSLYGKFGQRGDLTLEETITDNFDYYSNSYYNIDEGAWVIDMQIGNFKRVSMRMCEEGFNSFPAIAAHVTDYARLYLWELIKQAGPKNVYYFDTDSMFVNSNGYMRLLDKIDHDKLGMLKCEKRIENLTIHGLKDYEYDNEYKHKGIPKTAKQLSNNTFQYLFFPGLRTDLQNNMSNDYEKRYVIKKLNREYKKGILLSSGYTKPYHLSEW